MKSGDLKVVTVYQKDGKNVAFDVQNFEKTIRVDISDIENALQHNHKFVNAVYVPSTRSLRVDSDVPRMPMIKHEVFHLGDETFRIGFYESDKTWSNNIINKSNLRYKLIIRPECHLKNFDIRTRPWTADSLVYDYLHGFDYGDRRQPKAYAYFSFEDDEKCDWDDTMPIIYLLLFNFPKTANPEYISDAISIQYYEALVDIIKKCNIPFRKWKKYVIPFHEVFNLEFTGGSKANLIFGGNNQGSLGIFYDDICIPFEAFGQKEDGRADIICFKNEDTGKKFISIFKELEVLSKKM